MTKQVKFQYQYLYEIDISKLLIFISICMYTITLSNVDSIGSHKIDNIQMFAEMYHDFQFPCKCLDMWLIRLTLAHFQSNGGLWFVVKEARDSGFDHSAKGAGTQLSSCGYVVKLAFELVFMKCIMKNFLPPFWIHKNYHFYNTTHAIIHPLMV